VAQEARTPYRLLRQSRHGFALSAALNPVVLGVGFLVVLLGKMADGTWQMGVAFSVFLGLVLGLTLTSVASIAIELTGPGE